MDIGNNSQTEACLRHRVGLICNEDHDVFSAVAQRLRTRGIAVQFFEPGRRIDTDDIVDLTLLMNKKVDPHSFRALHRAESLGVRTWNGTSTVRLGERLVGYEVLNRAGARVPPVYFEKPDCDYVAKTYFDWHFEPDPELNGEGDFYQALVDADPVDFKYYAVDTGEEIAVTVLRTRSKLRGEKVKFGLESPSPGPAAQTRRVMRLTDSQAIGVDFVGADGEFWAVDVNPAMSFRGAEMEDELCESVLARLPDGESRQTDSSGVEGADSGSAADSVPIDRAAGLARSSSFERHGEVEQVGDSNGYGLSGE